MGLVSCSFHHMTSVFLVELALQAWESYSIVLVEGFQFFIHSIIQKSDVLEGFGVVWVFFVCFRLFVCVSFVLGNT